MQILARDKLGKFYRLFFTVYQGRSDQRGGLPLSKRSVSELAVETDVKRREKNLTLV